MIKVKLYGQPTSTYEYAKSKLVEALKDAGVEVDLIEINDVNAFIQEGIKSVPSIRVNGSLEMNYDKSQDINAFVDETIKNIMKEINFSHMDHIVVPTDFSASSENALRYAKHLAHHKGMLLRLVHAYHPVSADLDGVSVVDPHLESIKRKQLKKLCLSVQSVEDTEITVPFMDEEFRVGFATEEIITISKEPNTELIVIGSTGRGTTMKKWFGSVSLEVMKKAKAPVLVVPPKATFVAPQKVLYASDNPILDALSFEKLSEFLAPFDISLHIVHVGDQDEVYKTEVMNLAKSYFSDSEISYTEMPKDDICAVLEAYAKTHEIDLVVMSKKKKNFVDGLIHPSATKQMAIHTDVPLLVYHEADKICKCGGACKKIKKADHKC